MRHTEKELVGIHHEGPVLETDSAMLFSCQDRQVWIPLSELESYDEDVFVVPRWLADDRGLEPDFDA